MPGPHAVTGLVLAGGRSSRMGRDKAMLPFHGGPLISAVANALAARCAEVLISANDPETYRFLRLPVIADRIRGIGPLGGLHAGILAARHEWIFLMACDMPFFQPQVFDREVEAARRGEALAVFLEGERGPEPFHALYHRSLIPAVESAILSGEHALQQIIARVPTRAVSKEARLALDPKDLCLRNWNSSEDVGDTTPHRVPLLGSP